MKEEMEKDLYQLQTAQQGEFDADIAPNVLCLTYRCTGYQADFQTFKGIYL